MINVHSTVIKIIDEIEQLLFECDEAELHRTVSLFKESLLGEDEKIGAKRILVFFRSGMATVSDTVLMKNGIVQSQATVLFKNKISEIRFWAKEHI